MGGFNKGLVEVYTGNGKGKTTAAFGLAVRALGHGMRVYIGQFMKGVAYGELELAKKFPRLRIEQYGDESFFCQGHGDGAGARKLAEGGLVKARLALSSREFDLVILDEINVAVHFGLLKAADVLELIRIKPEKTELVLTGRYAPPEVVAQADLVTEMQEVRHYYRNGVQARDGIER